MIFENQYGLIDRLLHRLAFRAGRAQQAVADVEDLLFRDELRHVCVERPVFISALPRSGTTILLNLLVESGRFATHTYRDVPFVMCPMVWNRFSERFRADSTDSTRERAHGDGLLVSGESPEAFEEVIWKHFWPEHYGRDRIVPWSSPESNPEFERFLESHMRKIIAVRREDPAADLRYLSKNNTNIARLAAPPSLLQRGVFIVPFRNPLQHAASMLRQDERFVNIHEQDRFVQRYMDAMGHHEFGRGLKPVDFGGWLEDAPEPRSLEFWVRYWIAAYRFVHERSEASIVLVSYARLTSEPASALGRLAEMIDVPPWLLEDQAPRLRPPRSHPVEERDVSPPIRDEAFALYEMLEKKAPV